MGAIKQIPTPPNEWLHDGAKGADRYFSKSIVRPDNSTPWEECTDEFKMQWKAKYPKPLPDGIE